MRNGETKNQGDMMAEFAIDSQDGATEVAFLEYKAAQYGLRQRVAGCYEAVAGTLALYAAFEARLADDGDLAALAEYHAAVAAPLAGAETVLRETMAGLVGVIGQMQAAVPGLFPGVPGGS